MSTIALPVLCTGELKSRFTHDEAHLICHIEISTELILSIENMDVKLLNKDSLLHRLLLV